MKLVKISTLLIIEYGLVLILLNQYSLISFDNLINNITVFIGWIFALLLAILHLEKTRKDNQENSKEELKKSLEIKAFHEINDSINNLSTAIGEIGTKLLIAQSNIELSKKNINYNYDLKELNINYLVINLMKNHCDFVLSFERNEIVFLRYDHFRKFIQMKLDDLIQELREFNVYLFSFNFKSDDIKVFYDKCNCIFDSTGDISGWLMDLRIEIMNNFLSDIFQDKIPVRMPLDKRIKILSEIAKREDVISEFNARVRKDYLNITIFD